MSRTRAVLLSLILTLVIGLSGCSTAGPIPTVPVYPSSPQTPTPVPMPTPVLTNSGTSSTVAELEAKVRQLEAENQRLLAENQELSNKLVEVSSMLKSVQGEVSNLLIMATQVQNDASQLAAFLKGLPPLPTPPPGLDDIRKINNAVLKAVYIRELLKKLPPPPLFAPTEWKQLDEMKDDLIDMTEWMEDLEDLPDFLNIAGDLDDLREQEISHLENINGIMTNIKSVLERIQE